MPPLFLFAYWKKTNVFTQSYNPGSSWSVQERDPRRSLEDEKCDRCGQRNLKEYFGNRHKMLDVACLPLKTPSLYLLSQIFFWRYIWQPLWGQQKKFPMGSLMGISNYTRWQTTIHFTAKSPSPPRCPRRVKANAPTTQSVRTGPCKALTQSCHHTFLWGQLTGWTEAQLSVPKGVWLGLMVLASLMVRRGWLTTDLAGRALLFFVCPPNYRPSPAAPAPTAETNSSCGGKT